MSENEAHQIYNDSVNTTDSGGSDQPLIGEPSTSCLKSGAFHKNVNRTVSYSEQSRNSDIGLDRVEKRAFSLSGRKSMRQVPNSTIL